MRKIVLVAVACLVAAGCGTSKSPWAGEEAWFLTGKEVKAEYADVVYFVSTDIVHSQDEQGNASPRAVLTKAEKDVLAQEMAYIREQMFPDSLNFFAPYYHQLTMEALLDSTYREQLPAQMEATEQECLQAFNYYMEHQNGGRPFILAGFSQGAMMVKAVLKGMSDKQFAQMRAAYVLGDELTAEDLQCPHIIPATCASDKGVTISFNSVCSVDKMWPIICTSPAACINPLNWCTDATPAPLTVGDTQLSVAVDPDYQVVVVSGFGDNIPTCPFAEPWPRGNLHHFEIIFYNSSLRPNALLRAYSR